MRFTPPATVDARRWYREIPLWEMVRSDDPRLVHRHVRAPAAELHHPGTVWDGIGAVVWFRTMVHVPPDWPGPVVLCVGVDDRGDVFVDGVPRGAFLWDRGEVILDTGPARPGRAYFVAVRAVNTAGHGRFLGAALVRPDILRHAEAAADLEDDCRLVAGEHPELASALERARSLIDRRALTDGDIALLTASVDRARNAFLSATAPIADRLAGYTMYLLPQSHLDMAWLWRAADTPAKCAETFSRATQMMALFSDYVFTQSQAQAHAWTEERYPDLFSNIQQRAREGRWCPAGSMWVESDALMPCGEALVRQFLHGRTHFREKLGVVSTAVWLPDTFGFPATFPRIAAGSGMRGFYTVRVPADFPHHLYRWRCDTGDELLCVSPRTTYSFSLQPDTLFNDPRINERAVGIPWAASPIGPGDGGGGPDRTQLEDVTRLRSRRSLPALRYTTADDLFNRLQAGRDLLPVIEGELILPEFNGTWSSQAAIKRLNRRCEAALLEVETWAALAGRTDTETRRRLHELWRTLLFNQFHDILCGTSIAAVHDDAVAELTDTVRGARALRDAMLRQLAGSAPPPAIGGSGLAVVVCNPMGWHRTEPVEVSDAPGDATGSTPLAAIGPDGVAGPVQRTDTGLLFIASVPPYGFAVYRLVPGDPPTPDAGLHIGTGTLSNGRLSVRWDTRRGTITEIRDDATGAPLVRSAADQLLLCRDTPEYYASAWALGDDVSNDPGRRIPMHGGPSVAEHGPVRASLRMRQQTRACIVTRTVSLYRGIPRVYFTTEVTWTEQKRVLKTAFAPGFTFSSWTAETAFGSVTRPAPIDERPVHRWIAMHPADGRRTGMLLLNDASYACDVRDGAVRLTLCRAPVYPDPRGDRGTHRFGYAVESFRNTAQADRSARAFNSPLTAFILSGAGAGNTAPADAATPNHSSLLSVEPDTVIIEAVKPAHDGDGIIVRVRETAARVTPALLHCSVPFTAAYRTTLTEEAPVPLPRTPRAVRLECAPHQVVTVRLITP